MIRVVGRLSGIWGIVFDRLASLSIRKCANMRNGHEDRYDTTYENEGRRDVGTGRKIVSLSKAFPFLTRKVAGVIKGVKL